MLMSIGGLQLIACWLMQSSCGARDGSVVAASVMAASVMAASVMAASVMAGTYLCLEGFGFSI